jgi:hypothetical protein
MQLSPAKSEHRFPELFADDFAAAAVSLFIKQKDAPKILFIASGPPTAAQVTVIKEVVMSAV